MAVRIRLSREGRRNRPFYRIGVFDSRTARCGKTIDVCGHYDPLEKDDEKKVVVDAERVQQWFAKGAEPTESVTALLRPKGIHFNRGPKASRRKKKSS